MAGLYAILDWPHAAGLDPASAARGLLGDKPAGPGPVLLQLRCKGADRSTRARLIAEVGPLCLAAGVPLIVNDDLDVTLACRELVGGLHLGQDDLRRLGPPGQWSERLAALRSDGLLVGVSTHDLAQVRASAALPVDYLGFGPVQATRSKLLPEPCVGFDGLADACGASPRPVVAIGGLDAAGALRAARSGAAMVAMIGALTAASVPETRRRVVELAVALAAD